MCSPTDTVPCGRRLQAGAIEPSLPWPPKPTSALTYPVHHLFAPFAEAIRTIFGERPPFSIVGCDKQFQPKAVLNLALSIVETESMLSG